TGASGTGVQPRDFRPTFVVPARPASFDPRTEAARLKDHAQNLRNLISHACTYQNAPLSSEEWGRTAGYVSQLRSELAATESRVRQLEDQLQMNVVPESQRSAARVGPPQLSVAEQARVRDIDTRLAALNPRRAQAQRAVAEAERG